MFHLPSPNSSASAAQPLAATLPPELLELIFGAVQRLVPDKPQQQRERFTQSRVCRSWHAARLQRGHVFVYWDQRAELLLRSLEANPQRAGRIESLEISRASDYWARLLKLCPNVIECDLSQGMVLAPDALSFFPASLRKLTLYLSGSSGLDWIPSFGPVPPKLEMDIELSWGRPGLNALVVQALEPVAGNIVALKMFNPRPAREPGPLEALLPLTVNLKSLTAFHRQVHPVRFPEMVAGLGRLEEVRIVREDLTDYELVPQVVLDLVERAGVKLRKVRISRSMVVEPEWTENKMEEIRRVCAKREVVFVVDRL